MTLTLTMDEAAQRIGGGVTARWVRDNITKHGVPIITGSRGRKLVAAKNLELLVELAGNVNPKPLENITIPDTPMVLRATERSQRRRQPNG